jgi:selenocysteine lyase/cysteine desulfurase
MRSSIREATTPPRRWPLPPPTPALLQSGGDGRVVCDETSGLTAYGSAAVPRPGVIALSSCTASSPSEDGFAAADAARRGLAQAALDGDLPAEMQRQGAAIRAAIAEHYSLPPGAVVVLAASGTDAELLALAMAGRPGQALVNVLVAPEESGSGVPYAASACHFAEQTPAGPPVQRGAKVAGFPPVSLRTIPGRDKAGQVRLSAEVMEACAEAVIAAEVTGACAVLHLLDGSKTGYILPDPADLRQLARRHSQSVRVVVDACQGRGELSRIRLWLAEGWIVLVTGSKFYGGPPFSGAVLLPPSLAAELATRPLQLPEGLTAYTTRADWPENLAPATDLPIAGNPGLLLRWQAALPIMAEFRASPRRLREGRLARFAAAIPALIAGRSELRLLETCQSQVEGHASQQTIFSFMVLRNGRPLSLDDAKRLHRWLNADLSGCFTGVSGIDAGLARRLCLIGQPVGLPYAAVLRIAAGARRGAARVSDARIVFNKIALILQHWERISREAAG